MTPLYPDLQLLAIAEDLRDESNTAYIYKALAAMRDKYEMLIAELTPPPVRVIDYKKPIVLIRNGKAVNE